jgi:hypothetical protein
MYLHSCIPKKRFAVVYCMLSHTVIAAQPYWKELSNITFYHLDRPLFIDYGTWTT